MAKKSGGLFGGTVLFAHKYIYCSVTFDGQKSYWYRTNDRGYRVGNKVIVPVHNKCKWKQGVITRIEKYTADKVPLPLDETKGIVSKYGLFGEAKIKKYNEALGKCRAGALDISVFAVKTKEGYVDVITTAKERKAYRKDRALRRFFLIETFPPAVREQVANRPPEWKKRANYLSELENEPYLDPEDEFDAVNDDLPEEW